VPGRLTHQHGGVFYLLQACLTHISIDQYLGLTLENLALCMQALSALEDAVHYSTTETSQDLIESIDLMDQASRQAGRLMNVIDDAAVSIV
jgi:hypothetical protein